MAVGLDGDGSTTYMVTAAAMLPLYRRLGMSTLVFACIVMMASQNMNLVPWGGPTARAATALHVDPADVFVPLIPAIKARVRELEFGACQTLAQKLLGLESAEQVRAVLQPLQQPMTELEY